MARRRRGRDVTGIVLLDKPTGLTSNQALQRVKRLYDANKAGHTGSLDPLASGLLPLCLGHATKVCAYLLDADKRYEVTARFGATTTTGDADGEIVQTTDVLPDAAAIDAAVAGLTGAIEQVPPMYSALKHQGQRLYKLARAGVEVERPPRPVTIHALQRTGGTGTDVHFSVHCSKGTYVRTLVEDLARACNSLAHVAALRRTAVGPYVSPAMVTIEDLDALRDSPAQLDARLVPVDSALQHWPGVHLGADAAAFVLNGQAVNAGDGPATGWVRMYGKSGDFLGLGEVIEDGRIAPRRLFR